MTAGGYPSSCSGLTDPNYTPTYVGGTVTVKPAALTITASSPKIAYGSAVPVITASYDDFVNHDTAASLSTKPSCSTTVTSKSPNIMEGREVIADCTNSTAGIGGSA